MPTFNELNEQLKTLKNKKTVVEHLVQYVDTNFMPQAGQEPTKTLLNDEKLPVPQEAIETVVTSVLVAELNDINERIAAINNTNLAPVVVPPETTT
jgi:hypothetical protein